ncbi:MAG: hypothetical protein LBC87_00385 [Fibromonadaceae bacterium]|jgi:hypothetical protein|nr:hypothetical protein [Fibromonadaceae bacterium]
MLKKIIPKKIWLYARQKKTRFIHREKKISFGLENPKKTFYIIGSSIHSNDGIFALAIRYSTHIEYALSKNYIPIIDMQNYDNQYLDGIGTGKENAWEYFFEQPCGFDLSQIRNSKNIIIAGLFASEKMLTFLYYNRDFDSQLFLEFKKVFQKYIKFNEVTKNYINEKEQIIKDKRVLGVLARGTDYILKKPSAHPIQPDAFELIEKTKETMQKYNLDFVYLATEDESIFENFSKEFGEKLIHNNQKRIKLTEQDLTDGKLLVDFNFGRERDKYHLGLEYIASIYILSRCKYFIGGFTSGTISVMLMTQGFEYKYVYDLGCYP